MDIFEKCLKIGTAEALTDAFELLRVEEPKIVTKDGNLVAAETGENYKEVHAKNKEIRSRAAKLARAGSEEAADLYRRSLLFDAPGDLDAYIMYMEWDRPYEKKFYEPRRKQLKVVVDALQRLETDEDVEMVCVSMPPGCGKTTTAYFYITWLAGRHPDLPMLCCSHSTSIMKGGYNELLRFMDPNGDYKFLDVFPQSNVVNTDAKNLSIDLGTPKRFATIEMTSVGPGNAGKLRAATLLYCDDLVPDIETAMSKDRLDKLWAQYNTDLRQRKIGKCKELHIATRWSIYDVIGRLENIYEDNPRAIFINIPAMDEHDESNFDYPFHLGFTTEYFRKQREMMDDVSWSALYMGKTMERVGRVYDPEELRYYYSLPEGDPDAILAVVDSKEQGKDYCVMPVAYQYGNDYYLDSFICDNGKPNIISERIAAMICDLGIQMVCVESNRGGMLFSENIDRSVKEKGGNCSISTKWNQTNKETRILVASGWIKQNVLFREDSNRNKEYSLAMGMLTGYSMAGKNVHDDVPDAMSQLYDFVRNRFNGRATILKRPW